MNLMTIQMIAHPLNWSEKFTSGWEKRDKPFFVRLIARPVITFIALEMTALMALVYHSVSVVGKGGVFACKMFLLNMPIARLQSLGCQFAKDLSWQSMKQDHIISAFSATYQVITGSFTAIKASPQELSTIKHIILPKLDSSSRTKRAWTFVKQPKVLATVAIGASLLGIWALYSSQSPIKRPKEITIGTTSLNGGNAQRTVISNEINQNHREYASQWRLRHEVEDTDLLKGECTVDGAKRDCEAYWNKVAVLNRWLAQPSAGDKEEWYIMMDDDMAVTNMSINPNQAIDDLRTRDSSIIIAQDVMNWRASNPNYSVNTGVMFVRKDSASRSFFSDLWAQRNTIARWGSMVCPTLGVCKQQQSLHEQEAFSNLLIRDPGLLRGTVTVVPPRDDSWGSKRKHIALKHL